MAARCNAKHDEHAEVLELITHPEPCQHPLSHSTPQAVSADEYPRDNRAMLLSAAFAVTLKPRGDAPVWAVIVARIHPAPLHCGAVATIGELLQQQASEAVPRDDQVAPQLPEMFGGGAGTSSCSTKRLGGEDVEQSARAVENVVRVARSVLRSRQVSKAEALKRVPAAVECQSIALPPSRMAHVAFHRLECERPVCVVSIIPCYRQTQCDPANAAADNADVK